jgi:hypothetical protein
MAGVYFADIPRPTDPSAMPKYFFHVTDGERSTKDLDGVELSDRSAAAREAKEMADTLLTGSLVTRQEWLGWCIEVHDEDGQRVLSLPIS